MEEITSRKNPLIQHIKRLGAERKARREAGEYLCLGDKLYFEALRWDAPIRTVLFCGEEPDAPEGARLVRVPKDLLESVAPMKSTPELLFTCALPELTTELLPGRCLILENMQDPGNVGTVLRTADALRCSAVILAGACADPYSPKAVRASMGAVFRRRVLELDTDALIEAAAELDMPIFAAALDPSARDIREIELPASCAFAIGNEGGGLSEKLLAAARERVIIPMDERCESLNAAAAATVLLWEMFRRG